jgi:hypothetical protein
MAVTTNHAFGIDSPACFPFFAPVSTRCRAEWKPQAADFQPLTEPFPIISNRFRKKIEKLPRFKATAGKYRKQGRLPDPGKSNLLQQICVHLNRTFQMIRDRSPQDSLMVSITNRLLGGVARDIIRARYELADVRVDDGGFVGVVRHFSA